MDFPISTLIGMLLPPVGLVVAVVIGVMFVRCLFSQSSFCCCR